MKKLKEYFEGITVVECMIILSIIGILLSILIPNCLNTNEPTEEQKTLCSKYCKGTEYLITRVSKTDYSSNDVCQCIDIDRDALYLE